MAHLSEEQFIALVKKAESDAENNLSRYKLKVALFALLGYAVIFGLFALLIMLVGGTATIALTSSALLLLLIKKKLIFGILIAIWVLGKALWVRFERPEGYELNRSEYPQLFEQIDGLTKELNALKIHRVILNRDLNAAVVQHSRLGVLGWNENILILGLQLMLTLSEDEMRSVLAHEFGHLSGNHSRFNAAIYRARHAWDNIMENFSNSDAWGTKWLAKFFSWYVPRFSAYTFALARNNEFEADAIAAKLTSPETAAKALVNVHATAPFIEKEYWESYYKQADLFPEPQHKPYEGLRGFMQTSALDRTSMLKRIKAEMQQDTHYADTHPALRDRVDALQSKPVMPSSPTISSADAWLGEKLSSIMSDFDQAWLEENRDSWKNRFDYVQEAQSLLASLSDRVKDELSDEELWKLASVTHEFKSDGDAKPLYLAYLARHPEDRDAAFYLGTILYREEDEACMPYFAIAIKSARYIQDAGQMGYHLLNEKKKPQSAEEWWDQVTDQHNIHRAAEAERSSIEEDDRYFAPTLENRLQVQFKNALFTCKNVQQAWVACKELTHYPEFPVYVVAVQGKGDQDALEQAVNEAFEHLSEQIFVVSIKGNYKPIAKKIKSLGVELK